VTPSSRAAPNAIPNAIAATKSTPAGSPIAAPLNRPNAAISWDLNFRATSWSAGAEALFGFRADEMLGEHALRRIAGPGYRSEAIALRHRLLERRCGESQTLHVVARDGHTVVCEWEHAPVMDGEGRITGFVSTARELAKHSTSIAERVDVFCDPITGAASAASFADRTERAIALERRHGGEVAVLVVELDRFAAVERTLGRRVADELFRAVASRLSDAVRDCDCISRLGGERFAALLVRPAGVAGAVAAARRLLGCFVDPFFLADAGPIAQTASVGVSLFPGDARDGQELLRTADLAVRRARDLGGDGFQLAGDCVGVAPRSSLERDLPTALGRNEIEAHFRPRVALADGSVDAAVSLVRWRHPKRGLVEPGEFLGRADQSGTIVNVGLAVLRGACRAMRSWQDAGFVVPRVTVNVSGRELRRQFVDEVAAALCETNLDPGALELELTESVVFESGSAELRLLEELRSFGVRLAIDDFGIGRATLAPLQRIAFHALKIDRSFVADCGSNAASRAIVQSIVDLARRLEMIAVAEGVETSDQEHVLRCIGCDFAEGDRYGAPVTAGEFPSLASRAASAV
jgi:diguanylate cyclase (GGDEF)-like protein/PAS domain S-box-containing protein